jgi:peroxiredoxin
MTAMLQPQLDAITEQTRRLVQPERLATIERAISELLPLESQIAKPGITIESFTLPDAQGRKVRSEDLLALGPLILKFFRGRWDPYCSTELEEWRDLYDKVRARGALLVAISPQTVRQNDFLVQQHKLPFPILRDEACLYAATLGLAWIVPEYLQQYYRSIMVNIPFINGEQSWRLPLPATAVVDKTGTLQLLEVHADFRVRPEPESILNAAALL